MWIKISLCILCSVILILLVVVKKLSNILNSLSEILFVIFVSRPWGPYLKRRCLYDEYYSKNLIKTFNPKKFSDCILSENHSILLGRLDDIIYNEHEQVHMSVQNQLYNNINFILWKTEIHEAFSWILIIFS